MSTFVKLKDITEEKLNKKINVCGVILEIKRPYEPTTSNPHRRLAIVEILDETTITPFTVYVFGYKREGDLKLARLSVIKLKDLKIEHSLEGALDGRVFSLAHITIFPTEFTLNSHQKVPNSYVERVEELKTWMEFVDFSLYQTKLSAPGPSPSVPVLVNVSSDVGIRSDSGAQGTEREQPSSPDLFDCDERSSDRCDPDKTNVERRQTHDSSDSTELTDVSVAKNTEPASTILETSAEKQSVSPDIRIKDSCTTCPIETRSDRNCNASTPEGNIQGKEQEINYIAQNVTPDSKDTDEPKNDETDLKQDFPIISPIARLSTHRSTSEEPISTYSGCSPENNGKCARRQLIAELRRLTDKRNCEDSMSSTSDDDIPKKRLKTSDFSPKLDLELSEQKRSRTCGNEDCSNLEDVSSTSDVSRECGEQSSDYSSDAELEWRNYSQESLDLGPYFYNF